MSNSIFSLRTFLYFVYAVLLTAVLLVVRFPAEKFKVICEQRVEKILPGSSCSIDRIVYHFPLTAALESIKITRTIDGQESDLVVDQLSITPRLQFWRTFTLKGKIRSGLFRAGLEFGFGTHTFQLANVHLRGLDAGELAESIGLTDRKLSGIIEFSGEYRGPNNKPDSGVGKGVIQIVGGSMDLLQPILGLSTLEFDKLTVKVTQQNDMLNFVAGELQGKELFADFAGEMRIAYPLVNSNILLSGHLQPDKAYLAGHPREQQFVMRLLQRYKMTVLPFKIGGTVKRPLFRFST